MKTSWIIAIVMLWVVFFIFGSIAEQQNTFGSSQVSQGQSLMQPVGTDITGLNSIPVIGQAISLITNVWSYLVTFIQMVFLWFPDLWAGSWLWFYFILPFPVSVGLVISIVFILRGVHNA